MVRMIKSQLGLNSFFFLLVISFVLSSCSQGTFNWYRDMKNGQNGASGTDGDSEGQSENQGLGGGGSINTVPNTSNPAPTVTGITSDAGSLAGGETVAISGTGFVTGALVDIDGTCTVLTVTTEKIECTISSPVPTHAAATVPVTVTNPDGQVGIMSSAYTFFDASVPAVTLNPASLSILEGINKTFTVVLNTRPIADVVIAVASSDLTEASVFPFVLTFSSANWSAPQTVSVSASDDNIIDGNQNALALLTLSSTSDPNYAPIDPNDVNLTILDANAAGVTVSPTSLTINEGEEDTFTVKLNTQPGADVVIGIASSDTTEASVSPASLIFAPTDWNTNQTVTVTGQADSTVDGNQSATALITVSSSADPNYSPYNPPDVSLTINDSETGLAGPPNGPAVGLAGAPTITSITPEFGSSDGGTPVIIIGSNLLGINTLSSTVTLGGIPCAVTANATTSIECMTGRPTSMVNDTEKVNLTVINSDSRGATLSEAFTYVNLSVYIHSVNPSQGDSQQPTTITLKGLGFAANTVVKLTNGSGLEFSCFSADTSQAPSQISCQVMCGGPLPAGTYAVKAFPLNNPSAKYTKTNAFNCPTEAEWQVITITSVDPLSSHSSRGGEWLTIEGQNLQENYTVLIGDRKCQHQTFSSDCNGNTIPDDQCYRCLSPDYSPLFNKFINVQVKIKDDINIEHTNNFPMGGTSNTIPYLQPIIINYLSPFIGIEGISPVAYIGGTGFGDNPTIMGNEPTVVRPINNNLFKVRFPNRGIGASIQFQVDDPSMMPPSKPVTFSYVENDGTPKLAYEVDGTHYAFPAFPDTLQWSRYHPLRLIPIGTPDFCFLKDSGVGKIDSKTGVFISDSAGTATIFVVYYLSENHDCSGIELTDAQVVSARVEVMEGGTWDTSSAGENPVGILSNSKNESFGQSIAMVGSDIVVGGWDSDEEAEPAATLERFTDSFNRDPNYNNNGTGQFGTQGTGQFGTQGTGQFGTQGTGQFGTQGTGQLGTQGTGQLGTQGTGQLDAQGISSLAYDPKSQFLYATGRFDGSSLDPERQMDIYVSKINPNNGVPTKGKIFDVGNQYNEGRFIAVYNNEDASSPAREHIAIGAVTSTNLKDMIIFHRLDKELNPFGVDSQNQTIQEYDFTGNTDNSSVSSAFALDPSGRIIGGGYRDTSQYREFAVFRSQSLRTALDSSLFLDPLPSGRFIFSYPDPTVGVSGSYTHSLDTINAIKVLNDGRILYAGGSDTFQAGDSDFFMGIICTYCPETAKVESYFEYRNSTTPFDKVNSVLSLPAEISSTVPGYVYDEDRVFLLAGELGASATSSRPVLFPVLRSTGLQDSSSKGNYDILLSGYTDGKITSMARDGRGRIVFTGQFNIGGKRKMILGRIWP